MQQRHFKRTRRVAAHPGWLAVAAIAALARPAAGAMDPAYCHVPGFVASGTSVKPNVVILLDNSLSMGQLAYRGNAVIDEDRFDPGRDHAGYLDPDLCYAWTSNRFVPGPPSAVGPGPSECGNDPAYPFSGNFMNWALMTRMEVARQVLTGGPWDPVSQTLPYDRAAPPGWFYPDLVGDAPIDFCDDPAPYTDLPSSPGFHMYRLQDGVELRSLRFCDSSFEGYSNHTCFSSSPRHAHENNGPFDCDPADAVAHSAVDWFVDSNNRLKVEAIAEPTGVMHDMADVARWGLAIFDTTWEGMVGDEDNIGHGGELVFYPGDAVGDIIDFLRGNPLILWTPTMESLVTVGEWAAGNPQPFPSEDPMYALSLTRDPYYEWETGLNAYVPCRKTFTIVLTDGEPANDEEVPAWIGDPGGGFDFDNDGHDPMPVVPVAGWPPPVHDGDGVPPGDDVAWGQPADSQSDWLDDAALYYRTQDLRPDLDGEQNLVSYYIYTFGRKDSARFVLWNSAINGAFVDKDGDGLPSGAQEWDEDGDGEPDAFFLAEDGGDIEDAIRGAVASILDRTSTGTGVAVVPQGESGGSVVAQAYFNPTVNDGFNELQWAGYVRGLWLDPAGNVREDAASRGALVLSEDRIVDYEFDIDAGITWAYLYADADADMVPDDQNFDQVIDELDAVSVLDANDLVGIFEAGQLLQQRAAGDRFVYTTVESPQTDGSSTYWRSPLRVDFDVGNELALQPLLDTAPLPSTETADLIDYVRGVDTSYWRNRSITWQGLSGVWKLGDVMHSSPFVLLPPGVMRYIDEFGDESYAAFVSAYEDRPQVAFVGANDGMLHAFAIGHPVDGDDPATPLTNETTYIEPMVDTRTGIAVDPGHELWGFVPQSLLPHLQWLKEQDYCHTYYVDLTVKERDVRIFTPDAVHVEGWGTVLVGGFRLGCKQIATGAGTFRSAVFVLDVTDVLDPQLLLEFSDSDLGFTKAAPSIARISASPGSLNAEGPACWSLVFGSGPHNYEFNPTQQAHLWVVPLGSTIEPAGGCPGAIEKLPLPASAAHPFGVAEYTTRIPTFDLNRDFSVDGAYFGTVVDDGLQFDGRLMRLITDGDLDSGNWRIEPMLDTPGPFNLDQPTVAAVGAEATNTGQSGVFVYAGTGIFEELAHLSYLETQAFYGVNDACWSGSEFCAPGTGQFDVATELYDVSGCVIDLDLVTGAIDLGAGCAQPDLANLLADYQSGSYAGWRHDLTLAAGERVLTTAIYTDPVLLATSYVPDSASVCSNGGESYLYFFGADIGLLYQAPESVGAGIVQPPASADGATVISGLEGLDVVGNPFGRGKILGMDHIRQPLTLR